ncbi:MAG TPA: LysR family transcriptional regulator [Anaerolineales bacterium]|nr:LysR family transcriptional regulator [Anaerolineales bacterium]
MLNIYKLSIFSTVAGIGSFNQAAKELYLSQSAISQHIATLEKQLGTLLFKRQQRGVALTPAGETLLKYARQILWLTQAAESALTNIENIQKGALHLGATPSASIYLLPDWINNFHKIYPSIKISLDTNITSHLIRRIKNQSLELAIMEGEIKPDSALNIIPLKDTELLVIIPPNHAWSKLDSISVRSLGEMPFIARQTNSNTRIWIDRFLAEYDIIPNITLEFDNPENIKHAVIHKMGISILPACTVQKELANNQLIGLPLKEGILKRLLKCVWLTEKPLSAIGRAFLDTLSKDFPVLTKEILSQQKRPFNNTFAVYDRENFK